MEATWQVEDGSFAGRGPLEADIWLVAREEDCVFGLVEVWDPAVQYTAPPTTLNTWQLHSSYVDSKHPDTSYNGSQHGGLYVQHDRQIAYFRFPAWQPDCTVERVWLKLWQGTEGGQDKQLAVWRVEQEWQQDNLTWNTRPDLTQELFEFQLEPGEMFTELDVTDFLSVDPAALENFAVTEKSDLERSKVMNGRYREPRLVTYCKYL